MREAARVKGEEPEKGDSWQRSRGNSRWLRERNRGKGAAKGRKLAGGQWRGVAREECEGRSGDRVDGDQE